MSGTPEPEGARREPRAPRHERREPDRGAPRPAPAGDGAQTTGDEHDAAVEDTFPASDPPAH